MAFGPLQIAALFFLALFRDFQGNVRGHVGDSYVFEDGGNVGIADVDEHVGVGEAADIVAIQTEWGSGTGYCWRRRVSKVFFKDFFGGNGMHAVVVKLEPSAINGGLDEGIVVAAIHIALVNQDAVIYGQAVC